MNLNELKISGRWLLADCGKIPSENNCQMKMMAPERQRDDLLNAAVSHAVNAHSHEETPELRKEIDNHLKLVEA